MKPPFANPRRRVDEALIGLFCSPKTRGQVKILIYWKSWHNVKVHVGSWESFSPFPFVSQHQYGRRENALYRLSLFFWATYLPINKKVWYRVSLLIALWIRWLPCKHVHNFLTCTSILLGTCGCSWQTPSRESEFLCFEIKFSLLAVNSKRQQECH